MAQYLFFTPHSSSINRSSLPLGTLPLEPIRQAPITISHIMLGSRPASVPTASDLVIRPYLDAKLFLSSDVVTILRTHQIRAASGFVCLLVRMP